MPPEPPPAEDDVAARRGQVAREQAPLVVQEKAAEHVVHVTQVGERLRDGHQTPKRSRKAFRSASAGASIPMWLPLRST
jgi:hypothetical protein